jgi:hypothetical protein
MKIAMFRDTLSGYTYFREAPTYPSASDVRISEYVDVDFPIIQDAVEAAQKAITYRTMAKNVLEDYEAKSVTAQSTVGLTKN